VDVSSRVDCYLGESDCYNAGCCWQEHTDDNDGTVPWCFQADGSSSSGYVLTSFDETSSGMTGVLTASNPSSSDDPLGADISVLSLEVTFGGADQVRVKITDPNDPDRWEVPESVVPSVAATAADSSKGDGASLNYAIEFTEAPFTLTVTRLSDGAVLFSSSPNLVFKDQVGR
jgi:hypothetical protein